MTNINCKVWANPEECPSYPKCKMCKELILPHCPYCGGDLKLASPFIGWTYDCLKCKRAWILMDDYWLAGFDAGGAIYECNQTKQIYGRIEFIFKRITDMGKQEEIWDEYRKRKNQK